MFVCARWAIVYPRVADPLVTFLQRHTKQVVLVEQPPELTTFGGHSVAQVAAYRDIRPEPGVRQYWSAGNCRAYEAGRRVIRDAVAGQSRCTVLQTRDLFSEGSRVWFFNNATLLYLDDNHLTTEGTFVALPRIRDTLAMIEGDRSTAVVGP